MKVLVSGGREFRNKALLDKTLDGIHKKKRIELLIHGGARGADSLAHLWAMANGVQTVKCDVNWHFYGKAAGPRRNALMLELEPSLVVIFPGGSGTANMLRLARSKRAEIMEVKDE